jgi:hypothetical protein
MGRNGKRAGVTILGFTLVLGGLAGLVLPIVPGWLLIIPGLAILATEYVWAQRVLEEAKRRARAAAEKVRRRKPPPTAHADPALGPAPAREDSEGPGTRSSRTA